MVGVLMLTAILSAPGQASPPKPAPTDTALVTTYADGSTSYDLVSERPAWRWTPRFPLIDGASVPAGVPSALKLARQLDGDVAKVTVSLLYFRRGAKPEIEVASVVVPREGSVSVDEPLRRYGVQPIRLSLSRVTPPVPYPPSVFSDIPELEVSSVEVLTAPYPGYRVTVRNLSAKATSSFAVQSYRGEVKALSGLESGRGGRPVLAPLESYAFNLNLTNGDANGPKLLDTIEITSVMWADGSSAGAPMNAAAQGVPLDAGRRVLLEETVKVLRAALSAPNPSVDSLATDIAAIPDRDPALLPNAQRSRLEAKRMVLDDVRRFRDAAATNDVTAVRAWLQMMIRRYVDLIARLSPL